MAVKYEYFVKVTLEKEQLYVTGEDAKMAYWEKGKEAKKMSKTHAEDLVFGLVLNGYPAYIVKAIEGTFKFTND